VAALSGCGRVEWMWQGWVDVSSLQFTAALLIYL